MPSPPKPWEVNNAGSNARSATTAAAAATPTSDSSTASAVTSSTTTINNSSSGPAVPSRPSTTFGTTSSYGGYGTTGYGTGYGASYTSPYSRYGSYGGFGTTYGGYGTYSPYNRFGSPYNRFGGYSGGLYGPNGPDEFSLSQRMEAGTRATFEIIEQIVGAFGGFAQMLDSTYMATHSSFMAMVGVAEQFNHLKHYLGQVFSVFALVRWMKRMFYRLTGRSPPPELQQQQSEREQDTSSSSSSSGDTSERRRCRRPILFFFAVVLGLPFLLYKLVQQKKQQQLLIQDNNTSQPGVVATALYDFTAESPMELSLRKGDTVFVLSKTDPVTGAPASDWWYGRLPNGASGMFPANYVRVLTSTQDFKKF